MIDNNQFGIVIKELRESMEITQAQIAELIDKAAGTVGQYERGERFPNYKTFYRIIEFFDVDANLFFSRGITPFSKEAMRTINIFLQLKENERNTVLKFYKSLSHFSSSFGIHQIMDNKNNRLGIVIKELRETMHISQAQLAKSIGRSASTIGQFERGEVFPSFQTLNRMIEFFNVDANLFFLREKEQYTMGSIFILILLNLFKKKPEEEKEIIIRFHQNLVLLLDHMAGVQSDGCENEEIP